MIIYGYKVKQTHTEPLKYIDCPNFGQKDMLSLVYFSMYAHIFWIPMFPFRKTGALQCSACNKQLAKKNFTPEFKKLYTSYKDNAKHPKWMFTGTGIFVVLVAIMVTSVQASNRREKEYLQAPKVGDLYGVRAENDYTLMKVVAVGKDSLTMALNSMATNKMTEVDKLDLAYFYLDTANYSTAEIMEMYEQNQIYSIDRK